MKALVILFVISLTFFHRAYGQINDNCADAISLSVGKACSVIVYSNEGASAEEEMIAPEPSCGFYKGGDVWFSVAIPASGALRIETFNHKGATSHAIALYTGVCGGFTELLCIRQNREKTFFDPSLAGHTIFLRVFSFNGAAGSDFDLCVYEPPIPENDHCENASLLEVGSTCNLTNFSNAFATAEGMTVAADPSCGAFLGGDIWFKTIMPASGQLRINKNRGTGVTQPAMAIYSGSCGNFEEVLCSKNDATETLNAPSLAGETIYLRLYSYYSEEGFSFSLCLYEEAAPENDNCEDAISLSVGAICVVNDFTNLQASAQPTSTAPDPPCGAYKGADVWFTLKVPTSGKLRIETDVVSGPAVRSFTLYSGSCGNFEEVACMVNDKGETFLLPSLAGRPLYLRVFSLNDDDGGPFSLCVFEPALPPNDNCEDAISVSVNQTCNFEPFSNTYATKERTGAIPDPSCGQYRGGDVWFKTEVPASGQLRIGTDTFHGINKSIVVYSGTCGNFTEVACGQLMPYLHMEQLDLAGEIVYIRLFSYASDEGGDFNLCFQEFTCESDSVDAGEFAVCEGDSISLGSQVIKTPGKYTETYQSIEGCDSIVTVSVTTHTIETTVTSDGSILTATAEGAIYQWIDCSNGNLPIAGATAQSLTVTTPGEYAVILADNSCIDTSACISTHILGLGDDSRSSFNIYPNPVKDILNITLEFPQKAVSAELIDLKGIKHGAWKLQKKPSYLLNLNLLPSGVYILKLHSKTGITHAKVVKE